MTKMKRRGFVMTGGGAKGLYEAGVIHAFHITGMEFDVITGSSIGAMNAIFFAEYLLRKRALLALQPAAPEQMVEAMDSLVRSYHRAWLLMPEKNILDDSPNSPLGSLVSDLEGFDLSLADLACIGWWWKDPQKGVLPAPKVLAALLRTGKELGERLGKPGEILRILKDHPQQILREVIRTYLKRFEMEYSLIPAGGEKERVIEDTFTQPVTPLQSAHLSGSVSQEIQPAGKAERLVEPARTFKEYAEHQIDVRLTRANYRTGRLEISAYLSGEDFLRYMDRQAWRMDVGDPEKMPLGSFRLQLPGNPNAVKAALASGRFPGVFAPFAFRDIYPQESSENQFLYRLLKDWINDPEMQTILKQSYQKAYGSSFRDADWQTLLKHWQGSQTLRDFFPYETDTYIDGGAIDNTPSNSAIDATREWIDRQGAGKRDVTLDLYVIYLESEPKISRDEAQEPLLTEVVQRTLAVQSAAVKTEDAVVVKTINAFGNQAEALARTLLVLLEALKDAGGEISQAQREALEKTVHEIASRQGLQGYLGEDSQDILKRMESWARQTLRARLPLHVSEIKIYPERMPLSTLAFTERLGYRQEYAIEMLTMGCANTLWALRRHLEAQGARRDHQDELALALAKKWMGFDTWLPKGEPDRSQFDKLEKEWCCTRKECVFHAGYCARGAK